MSIKQSILGFLTIVSIAIGWNVLYSQPTSAAVFDGKTCASDVLGQLIRCPTGKGPIDLAAEGIVVIPNNSTCFRGDDPRMQDSPNAYTCNYDSPLQRNGVDAFVDLGAIRDTWIATWRSDNPGRPGPTEGEWKTLLNQRVARQLEPATDGEITCSNLSGIAKIRCEAVQSCIDSGGDSCEADFDSCMDGSSDEEKAVTCAEEIAPSGEATTCNVEGGLGWMLCPVMNTIADINDRAWDTIVEQLLQIPAISTDTSSGNALFNAWAVMRNIANVLFVIAFLFIIYSQITSMGVSNYGIKKMLPRLIMGAILVNTSYILTAGAVDISNVIGSSIYEVISQISGTIVQPDPGENEPRNWIGAVTLALVGGGALYMVGLATLLPLLVSAFFLIMGLLVTLAFRHSVLLILIVAAPLAAIAYMMPNTDKLSRSWWSLFKLLLILYPLIAFVVAVSTLAGAVIFDAAEGNWLLQLVGVAAPAMGILGIPLLVKATSGVLGRFGFKSPFSGIESSLKNRAKAVGKARDDYEKNRSRASLLRFANRNTTEGSSRPRRAAAWVAGAMGGGISGRIKAEAELAKSNAETQQTIFEEAGGLGGKLESKQRAMRENRIVSSAAEGATKQGDLVEFANKTDKELSDLAGGSPEMISVLKQQRASAVAQAASAASTQYADYSVPQVAEELKEAIREGDRVRTQALTNKITMMGGAGASKLREVYATLDDEFASGNLDKGNETIVSAYKQMNSAVRSSGLKAKAADVYAHSTGEGYLGTGKTVTQRAEDGGTWEGLSDAELAGQTMGETKDRDGNVIVIGGIRAAMNKGSLPSAERLHRVVDSDVARSAGNPEVLALFKDSLSDPAKRTIPPAAGPKIP